MNWFQKRLIKFAIRSVVRTVKDYELKEPKIKELRTALYGMSIPGFNEWCLEALAKKELSNVTLPQYLKELIKPLRDDIEDIVIMVIDGFEPEPPVK